ncbi:GNAT family N-acetyltransferase [Rhabdobacter roseus]|uniref:GNAT superfamily N-acetyltransferase n=1 Tax=Rhabdobacter roseus TaxID=1655419 RepID=A0A840TM04_9BACT|nr:GNAT family N-acetyltransferase [Rhabdobacter roseus]MBB5282263.1 GNAT superfamily N-acetyltransferase [Rhabdobacter roseus]
MSTEWTYRLATAADLAEIVGMLADDTLGTTREKFQVPLPDSYLQAFAIIASDPHQELTVVESAGEIIATFQLSFIQYLTHQGGIRAQIEAVRVKATYRGQGIGTAVFQYAIRRAKEKGAHLLQLTTDKKRPDAQRFYEALGFVASHEGMKLHLGP